MKNETWRALPGFVGRYEINNRGQVRSVPRSAWCSDTHMRRIKRKLMATHVHNGQLRVALRRHNGQREFHYVNELVGLAFP